LKIQFFCMSDNRYVQCLAIQFYNHSGSYMTAYTSYNVSKTRDTYQDCWAMHGDTVTEIVYGEEKNICTGLTRAAKTGQKSLVPSRQANKQTDEEPLSCVLFESPPIHLSFNNQQRPTPPLFSMRKTSAYILFLQNGLKL
jgi:hypothetical protein